MATSSTTTGLHSQSWRTHELRDLRYLFEIVIAVVGTWIVLGWSFDRPITQVDGSMLVVPYVQSALHAGADWSDHLYRFGLIGGSKMHEFGGTMPIVQASSMIGLSTTTTVNVITIFVQVCFGFLGLKTVQSLVLTWSNHVRALSFPERLTVTWGAGFAPLIGWRLAVGHENLLIGLLPVVSAVALLCAARARSLTITSMLFAMFAVFNGLTGLGAQTVLYSVVFTSPFVLALVLDVSRASRWSRGHWIALSTLAAGVMVALPRLSVMIAHAFGNDASRALAEPVTYSFGEARWIDWLTSIPWTTYFARDWGGTASIHEHNFPVGPWIVLLLVLWPRSAPRTPLLALAAGCVLAIAFANNLWPISSGLATIVPPLEAFRVPARAVLPLLVFLPVLATAAIWAPPTGANEGGRARWLGVVLGVCVIVLGRYIPPLVCETVAWLGAIGLAVTGRMAPSRSTRWTLPVLAAFGVVAFASRFPRDLPVDPVEQGPQKLHDAVQKHAPLLRTALDRIEIAQPSPPYQMSMAWAANLPTLDGVWYPPRRFLELLGALDGRPLPPTTCVFTLTQSPSFPIFQQLYNVKYIVAFQRGRAGLSPLPATPGGAWFPTRVEVIADPSEMADQLHANAAAVPDLVRSTAWLLRRDRPALEIAEACVRARVSSVETDERGQSATFEVESPANCPLIVATNYISNFHATAIVDGASRITEVFPIDVALTAIMVPPGSSRVVLEPRADPPWWSRLASMIGILLVLGAAVMTTRSARRGQ